MEIPAPAYIFIYAFLVLRSETVSLFKNLKGNWAGSPLITPLIPKKEVECP